MEKFVIMLDGSGLKNVGVEVDDTIMDEVWGEIPQNYPQQVYKDLADTLRDSLKAMLPSIRSQGHCTDIYGEFYDQQKFDNDLIYLAMYDYIGYGTKIQRAEFKEVA